MGLTVLMVVLGATLLSAALPNERQITGPGSIVSASNAGAGAVPVEDVYYTRSVSGASWSPNGREIAFTTNLTGRENLWKVSASGGWPIQLSQSDDRQSDPVWAPNGKWIVYQQDFGGRGLRPIRHPQRRGYTNESDEHSRNLRKQSALGS